MTDREKIDNSLEQIKASRDTWRRLADGHRKEAYEADRMADELQKAIEFSTFGGKTYSEYVSSLAGQEFESDGIKVQASSYYSLIAEETQDGVRLRYEANIHASEGGGTYTVFLPPTESIRFEREKAYFGFGNVPKKYQATFDRLKAATDKLKVVKP